MEVVKGRRGDVSEFPTGSQGASVKPLVTCSKSETHLGPFPSHFKDGFSNLSVGVHMTVPPLVPTPLHPLPDPQPPERQGEEGGL